jgi:predicted O-methyltransferase YrrM
MKKGNLGLVENMYEYVLDNSLRESDVLNRLRLETEKDPSAIMQIPPEQGQLMALLIKLMGAKRTIEIGVYTGYSALCVSQAMPVHRQLYLPTNDNYSKVISHFFFFLKNFISVLIESLLEKRKVYSKSKLQISYNCR